MKIIHRYVAGQLLKSFLISLIVFTFILFMGNMLRLLDLLERGVAKSLLVDLFTNFIPYLLTFSIPMSILTASLLVFGRLSADNEVTAMRACGLGFSTIFKSGFIIAGVLTAVCLWINTSASPRAHYAIRKLRFAVGQQSPEAVLEPGVFIDYFKPYQFYIGGKEGKRFTDVIIYENLEDGRSRFLQASSGRINASDEGDVIFTLYDGTMEEPPREGETSSLSGNFKTYVVRMGSGEESESLPKKISDCTSGELLSKLKKYRRMIRGAGPKLRKDLMRRISILRTELSERYVFTTCVFFFIMIGMPLGVTAHRGETSIGGAISLALVALNYAFIICVEAFNSRVDLYPYILVWVPNAVFAVLGPVLTYRLERR